MMKIKKKKMAIRLNKKKKMSEKAVNFLENVYETQMGVA